MAIETLEELFLEEIRDLYDAEKQLVKALPKMAKAASSDELRSAFEEHLEQTKGQVERLEQIFGLMDEKPKGKTCKAMKGLIEEGNETASEEATDPLGDLGMIGAAQRVEHYEIAAYGTARTMAEQIGMAEAVSLLEQTLNEEEETDKKLTSIAETLYEDAKELGGEEVEEEEEEEDVEA